MGRPAIIVGICTALLGHSLLGQTLAFPPRPADAPGGREVLTSLTDVPLAVREDSLFAQIIRGNVPSFMRETIAVSAVDPSSPDGPPATFFAAADYLCAGSDSDWVYVPMTPDCAQRIAARVHASLPTRRMVDLIYQQAAVRLRPQPIPPGPAMITVPVFLQHTDSVQRQMAEARIRRKPGLLIAGHKKDVIISNSIRSGLRPGVPAPVVIYGWHRQDGTPIQPMYNGHQHTWADYSHGIRFVSDTVEIGGRRLLLREALADSVLCRFFSDEGPIPHPFYPIDTTSAR